MNCELIVYPSLFEDTREAWVWLPNKCKGKFKSGKMIKIIKGSKSIVLVCRIVDDNFEKEKNRRVESNTSIDYLSTMFLSYHYRDILGIENDKKKIQIQIEEANGWQYRYWQYFRQHPRAEVRLTFYLAIFSIGISLLSFIPFRCIYHIFSHIACCLY